MFLDICKIAEFMRFYIHRGNDFKATEIMVIKSWSYWKLFCGDIINVFHSELVLNLRLELIKKILTLVSQLQHVNIN